MSKDKADRFNNGKPELSFVPLAVKEGIARGLMFGAEKYDRDNWRKGLSIYAILDSLDRHVSKLADPDEPDIDEESGLHHADLIACNAAFLSHAIKHKWDK